MMQLNIKDATSVTLNCTIFKPHQEPMIKKFPTVLEIYVI